MIALCLVFLQFVILSACYSTHVLHVQQVYYKRKPQKNPVFFNSFYIDENQYRFMHEERNRTCKAVNCLMVDYIMLLKMSQDFIYKTKAQFKYVYVIEDDTYFCGEYETLPRLLDSNSNTAADIIFTGIGATGYLIRVDWIDDFIASIYYFEETAAIGDHSRASVDVLLWNDKHLLNKKKLFRTRVYLNIHLYHGSTRGDGHGLTSRIYGTCFEFSCNLGTVNWFDLEMCMDSDLYSMSTGCKGVSKGVLPIGYIGRHCMTMLGLNQSHAEKKQFGKRA
jgi:hypothetical protein